MTIGQLYTFGKNHLKHCEVEAADFEAAQLLFHFFHVDRQGLLLKKNDPAEDALTQSYLQAVNKRGEGYPLQYILGSWDFMGLSLKVGEGVLIPRDDTEVLVRETAALLPKAAPCTGLDLCAGTGAVALGLCSLSPAVSIACVELSDLAFSYLEQNLSSYPQWQVTAVKGDVLKGPANTFRKESLDVLVSNPPYIASEEIPTLQKEVQQEPPMALDGGKDGLIFYKAICDLWTPLLKPGGIIGFEIGETQGEAVCALLEKSGFTQLKVHKDLGGLDRVITGRKGEQYGC